VRKLVCVSCQQATVDTTSTLPQALHESTQDDHLISANPNRVCKTEGCRYPVSSDRKDSSLNPHGRGTKYYRLDGLCGYHRHGQRHDRELGVATKRKRDEYEFTDILKRVTSRVEEKKLDFIAAEERLKEIRGLKNDHDAYDRAIEEVNDQVVLETNSFLGVQDA
jgi:hypothetical protein